MTQTTETNARTIGSYEGATAVVFALRTAADRLRGEIGMLGDDHPNATRKHAALATVLEAFDTWVDRADEYKRDVGELIMGNLHAEGMMQVIERVQVDDPDFAEDARAYVESLHEYDVHPMSESDACRVCGVEHRGMLAKGHPEVTR